MSNHAGGYMLNEVLERLFQYGVFEWLGLEKSRELVGAVLKIGDNYDCNNGEILHQLGRKVGVCSACARPATIIYQDFCQPCFQEHYEVDQNGDISLTAAEDYWGYSKEQLLSWLRKENIVYRQDGPEYYANFIALENCIDKISGGAS